MMTQDDLLFSSPPPMTTMQKKDLVINKKKTSPTSVADFPDNKPNNVNVNTSTSSGGSSVRWSENLNQKPTPSQNIVGRPPTKSSTSSSLRKNRVFVETTKPKSILRRRRAFSSESDSADCPSDETTPMLPPIDRPKVRISNQPAETGEYISGSPSAMGFVDISGMPLSPIPSGSLDGDENSNDVSPPRPTNTSGSSGHGNNHNHEDDNPNNKTILFKELSTTTTTTGMIQSSTFEKNIPEQYHLAFQKKDDDSGFTSDAYTEFIESVASVVVQTAARQFLAKIRVRQLRAQQQKELERQRQLQEQKRIASITLSRQIAVEQPRQLYSAPVMTFPSSTARLPKQKRSMKPPAVPVPAAPVPVPAAAAIVPKPKPPKTPHPRHMFDVAAIRIQAAFRGFWARDCLAVDHYCAIIIQKQFRFYRCRYEFLFKICCVVSIQSAIRGHLVRRVQYFDEQQQQQQLQAPPPITSPARGLRPTNILARDQRGVDIHRAATMIQSRWRCFLCELDYLQQYESILIVQGIFRGWYTRRLLHSWLKAHKIKSPLGSESDGLDDSHPAAGTYALPQGYDAHTAFMKQSLGSPIKPDNRKQLGRAVNVGGAAATRAVVVDLSGDGRGNKGLGRNKTTRLEKLRGGQKHPEKQAGTTVEQRRQEPPAKGSFQTTSHFQDIRRRMEAKAQGKEGPVGATNDFVKPPFLGEEEKKDADATTVFGQERSNGLGAHTNKVHEIHASRAVPPLSRPEEDAPPLKLNSNSAARSTASRVVAGWQEAQSKTPAWKQALLEKKKSNQLPDLGNDSTAPKRISDSARIPPVSQNRSYSPTRTGSVKRTKDHSTSDSWIQKSSSVPLAPSNSHTWVTEDSTAATSETDQNSVETDHDNVKQENNEVVVPKLGCSRRVHPAPVKPSKLHLLMRSKRSESETLRIDEMHALFLRLGLMVPPAQQDETPDELDALVMTLEGQGKEATQTEPDVVVVEPVYVVDANTVEPIEPTPPPRVIASATTSKPGPVVAPKEKPPIVAVRATTQKPGLVVVPPTLANEHGCTSKPEGVVAPKEKSLEPATSTTPLVVSETSLKPGCPVPLKEEPSEPSPPKVVAASETAPKSVPVVVPKEEVSTTSSDSPQTKNKKNPWQIRLRPTRIPGRNGSDSPVVGEMPTKSENYGKVKNAVAKTTPQVPVVQLPVIQLPVVRGPPSNREERQAKATIHTLPDNSAPELAIAPSKDSSKKSESTSILTMLEKHASLSTKNETNKQKHPDRSPTPVVFPPAILPSDPRWFDHTKPIPKLQQEEKAAEIAKEPVVQKRIIRLCSDPTIDKEYPGCVFTESDLSELSVEDGEEQNVMKRYEATPRKQPKFDPPIKEECDVSELSTSDGEEQNVVKRHEATALEQPKNDVPIKEESDLSELSISDGEELHVMKRQEAMPRQEQQVDVPVKEEVCSQQHQTEEKKDMAASNPAVVDVAASTDDATGHVTPTSPPRPKMKSITKFRMELDQKRSPEEQERIDNIHAIFHRVGLMGVNRRELLSEAVVQQPY